MKADLAEIILFGVSVVAALIAGIILGVASTELSWEEKAVKADKAEYYIDINNNKAWRWK